MHSDAASQASGWWQGCGAAYEDVREVHRVPHEEEVDEHHDEVRAVRHHGERPERQRVHEGQYIKKTRSDAETTIGWRARHGDAVWPRRRRRASCRNRHVGREDGERGRSARGQRPVRQERDPLRVGIRRKRRMEMASRQKTRRAMRVRRKTSGEQHLKATGLPYAVFGVPWSRKKSGRCGTSAKSGPGRCGTACSTRRSSWRGRRNSRPTLIVLIFNCAAALKKPIHIHTCVQPRSA